MIYANLEESDEACGSLKKAYVNPLPMTSSVASKTNSP